MLDLIGKIVEVITSETTYTGKLVEVGEADVYIESDESGWMVIPVERVLTIREK